MNSAPPTTSASLLASSRRLPARAAARHGARPAAPTIAAITRVDIGMRGQLARAPRRRAAPRCARRRRAGARAARAPRPRRRPRRSAAASARTARAARRCGCCAVSANDLEALRMARDHVERAHADRAGGAEDADALRPAAACAVSGASAAAPAPARSGSTGSSASMRSSTPPWPGSSALQSLAPALRLTSDSNRSPTTLIADQEDDDQRQADQAEALVEQRVQAGQSARCRGRRATSQSHGRAAARRACRSTRPPSSCPG